ncbi:MAG: hypothetical protein K2K02_09490 [Ruminococcus sp.]|nr:hypothetical protein [Ruminococcus sp.]
MGTGRQYDEKFKLEAIKLAKEIGTKKAAEELEELNEFLEEASAFFAASRQKYAKRKE